METNKRLTLGVLLGFQMYEGSVPNPFATPLIHGMQAAAHDQNINILISLGISMQHGRFRTSWPQGSAVTDFIPIGAANTDGLLIISPVRFPIQMQYIRRLMDEKFPILFIGTGSGAPTLMIDNEGGIRQIMEHLVEHGHREIAFLAGDETDPGDSQSRLLAYRQAVRDFNLAVDPRLVEFGQHWEVGGYAAARRMLHSGVHFTALVCSNDDSAVGVMRALREAGKRVPWDVAVTGFDDHLSAISQVPPLTSVHYPLFETGYRSVLLLQKRIQGGPAALVETTRIGTWIVKRQSCGCLPEIVQAAGAEAASAMPSAKESPRVFKDHLAQAMLESLLDETSPANIREIRPLCDRLVDSFIQSLQDGDLSHFQVALIDILQRVEIMQDDAHAWQAAISVLRQGLTSLLQDEHGTRRRERAEDLLHQARTMLSESARRKYTRLQLQQSYHDEAMGRLTARLLSTLDEDLVYDTVKENLPQIGIRNCHVVFFQEENGNPTASCITRPLEKDVRGIRFASNQFPPPGLMPESESYDLALLPLCFQEENLGFVAFDGAQLEPLASVIRQLASAIKSTQLHSQVLELSLTDSLTGVHNRRYFEILLQKEIERCQRYNRYLAVIMIDIDLFKEYNDAFGHLAGDEALREVAQCVSRGARRGLDVVTRYGGEEFTIILPETDANGAIVVAEHVRQLVETDSKFLRTVAISLGVAAQRGDQLRLQALVGQADKALYQAKQQGRNRSVVYEDWMVEAAHSATGEDSQTASLPTSEGE